MAMDHTMARNNTAGFLNGPENPGQGQMDRTISAKSPEPTPVERIGKTLNEARDLSGRIRGIVNGLIGTRPENEASDIGSGMTGGIITDLAENAEYALYELRRANDELSRLSKVLGLGL